MIIVHTVHTEFQNDLSEVIRLYYPSEEIGFFSDPFDAGSLISKDNGSTSIVLFLNESSERIDSEAVSGRYRGFCSSAEFGSYAQTDAPLCRKRMQKWTMKCALYRLLSEMNESYMPWGALTGIRPAKLYRDLVKVCGETDARILFSDVFGVSKEKRELVNCIYRVQEPIIQSTAPDEVDLYFHIPYCKSRCLYCSFGTELESRTGTLSDYLGILKRDIRKSAAIVRDNCLRIRSSYFGGGTPSILSPVMLSDLLECILKEYGTFGTECTFEAGRPDTISGEKLAVLKDYGIGRISINPQTMHDPTLARIGRGHSVESIEKTFSLARNAGFSWINMDLIMGLPGESFEDMRSSIDSVLSMAPENVTIHTLAIKRSSRLKRLLDVYSLPHAFEVDNAVRYGYQSMARNGYAPYYLYRQKYMQGNLENVGYARSGTASLYNVDIMEESVGIMAHGAGSISKAVFRNPDGEERIERVAAPKEPSVYALKLGRLSGEKSALFLKCLSG